jgi:hypothetical protein
MYQNILGGISNKQIQMAEEVSQRIDGQTLQVLHPVTISVCMFVCMFVCLFVTLHPH